MYKTIKATIIENKIIPLEPINLFNNVSALITILDENVYEKSNKSDYIAEFKNKLNINSWNMGKKLFKSRDELYDR